MERADGLAFAGGESPDAPCRRTIGRSRDAGWTIGIRGAISLRVPRTAVFVVFVLTLGATGASAAVPWVGGRFSIEGAPLLGDGPPATDAIWIGPDGVAIASGCDAVASRLRP